MSFKKTLWTHKLVTYYIKPRELTGAKHWSLQQD